MPGVAFALPLLEGQTEIERSALTSCWTGDRREAHRDARRRAGITREAIWIQPTPSRDLAVVYLEADNLDTASALLRNSSEPFDRWFRDLLRRVHGIAIESGLSPPELVLDFDVNRI
jgi:hypothetical protein